MGLVQTDNRKKLRKEITDFHNEILIDPLYIGIPSLGYDKHFFHAKDDHPEIRSAFYRFLKKRDDFVWLAIRIQRVLHLFMGKILRNIILIALNVEMK